MTGDSNNFSASKKWRLRNFPFILSRSLQFSSQLSDHSDCLNRFLALLVALSRITANRNCHFYSETDTALLNSLSYLTYNCSSQKLWVFQNDKNKRTWRKYKQCSCVIFWQLPTQVWYQCKCILKYLEIFSSIYQSVSRDLPPWKDTVGSCFKL